VKVLIAGATGMIGQGVLRECLLDAEVETVLTLGRGAPAGQHPKLRSLTPADLFDLSSIEDQLATCDACFFCLGITSVGRSEQEYRHITHDLTLSVARTLARLNPAMTFAYISASGADSTTRGPIMWARVKGQTENDLFQLPFKAAYMFRPLYIQPLHGIQTKTWWYGAVYKMAGGLYPLWKRLLPNHVTTTECLGRAMLRVAKQGASKRILESRDFGELC
jgi:uncharacterized protein YbjT (DUF2867 family)